MSGLSSLTRATDLKIIFSKYGKVIGAKVVTNTRTPGTRCYGYVTMNSSSDAAKCISHLHHTELHGRIISVERAKSDIGGIANKAKSVTSGDAKKDDETKSNDRKKAKEDVIEGDETAIKTGSVKSVSKEDGDRDAITADSGTDDPAKGRKRESTQRDSDRGSGNKRSLSAGRRRARPTEADRAVRRERERDVLSFQKIREERERQRLRERERKVREEERRRAEARRRQHEEEDRLRREREFLKKERLRLEREKADLLRLERERQKLEREKIELERLELKRQQLKYALYHIRYHFKN